MGKGNWFWHSRFMSWVEGALLDITNWVWKKRHVTSNYTKPKGPAKIQPTLQDIPKESATPKAPAKRAARKAPAKKSSWNIK